MKFLGFEVKNSRIITVPGVRTTTPEVIEYWAKKMPIFAATTKSIGPEPNYGEDNPVFAEVGILTFLNRFGLANPGVNEYSKELAEIYPLPNDVVLIGSVFGGNEREFGKVAEGMKNCCDILELNFSCPHSEKYGAVVGSDTKLVEKIIAEVKSHVDLPVMLKIGPLPPNLEDLVKIAKGYGVEGIAATNTAGPGLVYDSEDGTKLLGGPGYGGLSGPGIKPLSLRTVEMTKHLCKEHDYDLDIVGMGGIWTWRDMLDFEHAGAKVFGIGTALIGKDRHECLGFYKMILESFDEFKQGKKVIDIPLKVPDLMKYETFELVEIKKFSDNLKAYYFDHAIEREVEDWGWGVEPGQFIMARIKGKRDEIPLSIAMDDPLTILVRNVGETTSAMDKLEEGAEFRIRGPYGKGFLSKGEYLYEKTPYLVGGGTGVAPLLFLAKRIKQYKLEPMIFIGFQNRGEVAFEKEFRDYGELVISTEIKSPDAYHGFVTDALRENIGEINGKPIFYNCGPEKMMAKAIEIESKYTDKKLIYCLMERYIKCAVGVCGSCSDACTGTCYSAVDLKNFSGFGKWKRDGAGRTC